jgi:hypothetical protein
LIFPPVAWLNYNPIPNGRPDLYTRSTR